VYYKTNVFVQMICG